MPTWVATNTTLAVGTTSATPTWPTGYTPTAGHMAVMVVCSGHPTASTVPNTPSGWSLLETLSGGGGTYGADAGPRRVTIFTRELTGGDTLAAVTQSAGAQATISVSITIHSKASGSWQLTATSGEDITADTAFSVTGAADPGFTANDAVLLTYALQSNAPGSSAEAIAATGAVFAAAVERLDLGTTQGSDHRHVIATTSVSSGTATAAPVVSSTLSAAHTGVAAAVRLRELAGITVGQATETDSPQPVAWAPKQRLVGQATESDTAQAVAWAPKTRAVNLAAEVVTANTVTTRKTLTVGAPVESNTAFTVVRPLQTVPVGQAAETDTAEAVTARKTTGIGSTVETDTAQQVSARKTTLITQAAETDVAQTVTDRVTSGWSAPAQATTPAAGTPVATATETGTAQAVTARKTVTLGQAFETDAAQAVARSKRLTIGQATQTDTAQQVTPRRIYSISLAGDTNTSGAVTSLKRRQVASAVEIDTASALLLAKIIAVGRAAETDTAHAITVAAKIVDLDLVGGPLIRRWIAGPLPDRWRDGPALRRWGDGTLVL